MGKEDRIVSELEFMYETDPKYVSIKVVNYSKKFLSECQYHIEVEFKNKKLFSKDAGNQSKHPKLVNKRTNDDFEAFHMALANKFKNIKFPELPKSSTLSLRGAKVFEKRCEVFQKLLD